MITLQSIHTERDFFALNDIWDNLLARSNITVNKIFYSFEFMRLWWESFSSDYELLILLVKDKGEPIGIMPMVRHRNGQINEIRLLGDNSVDYQDFMITAKREESISLMLKFLSKADFRWDMLVLDNIPFDSPNAESFVKQTEKKKGITRLEPFGKAPYITITGSWDDFYKNIDKKMWNDTRRQLRRLHKQGELYFGRCQSMDEVSVLMDKVFKYKNNRYKETGKKGVYSDAKMRDFYLKLAQLFWTKDKLDISYVRLNEDIIAVHFGSIYEKKYYYWIPAFNLKYQKFSPSRILLSRLIEEAFNDNFKEFDFGFGQEPYKYAWTSRDRQLYRFLYFNRTFKGIMLRGWFNSWRQTTRQNNMLNGISRIVERTVTGK